MTTRSRTAGASTAPVPRTDLDITHYELRDLAATLEKLSDAGSSGRVSGTVSVRVNDVPGVSAVVRFRNYSTRLVRFK